MARKRPVKNRPETGQKRVPLRDPRGRFLPGTAAGPGRPANPYARRLAMLKIAFAEAVSVEDMQAVARKLLGLALRGDIGGVKVLLAALIGPVAPIDPDEIDRHEIGVRSRWPTELDELMLIAQGHGSNGRMPALAPMEDAEDDEDMPEPEPTPDGPDALTSWEEFAAGRIEWDPQAACPVEMIYLRYARWCGTAGLPLLAEADMCAWLRKNGASITTSTYSQIIQAQGVRVVD
jgi:hypothetical protein